MKPRRFRSLLAVATLGAAGLMVGAAVQPGTGEQPSEHDGAPVGPPEGFDLRCPGNLAVAGVIDSDGTSPGEGTFDDLTERARTIARPLGADEVRGERVGARHGRITVRDAGRRHVAFFDAIEDENGWRFTTIVKCGEGWR